jgi:CheY-like chemotaxis protein/HPt (histidine-containing phosphotransfer) domain-containing protein
MGSTFWFTARFGAGEEGAEARTAVPGAPAITGAGLLDGAWILVVEDNVFNQQVASEILGFFGASVRLAGNGREALELLEHEVFDLVLMDLQMPEMDGLEATRRIRSNPALRAIPIVAMTANAGEEDRQSCLEAGMDDFVSKPFQPLPLSEKLARLIAGSRARKVVPGEFPEARDERLPGTRLIDLSLLAATVNNDREKVDRFARLFVRSTRDGLDQAARALAEENVAQVSEIAHRLKSSARAVGANSFAELCLDLEKLKRRDDLPAIQPLLVELEAMFVRIEQEIVDGGASTALSGP